MTQSPPAARASRPPQRSRRPARRSPMSSRWSTAAKARPRLSRPPVLSAAGSLPPRKCAPSAYATAVAERHRAVAHAVAERALPLGGATRVTAVFGDPVEHSLSPAMHNAAYAALGLDRVYAAFHVRPPMLAAAVRALPALGILGVNLTVPHKERAVRMVAKLSAEARMLGAINCAVNRSAGLYGDNTDARGLERDLNSHNVELAGGVAIVSGARPACAPAPRRGRAGWARACRARLAMRRLPCADSTR